VIVVDSSVWINHFRDVPSRQVLALRTVEPGLIVAGDVIVLEILRGVRSERDAIDTQQAFLAYGVTAMLDSELAVAGAAHYRALRARGITVAKLADLIIATYCISRGHHLLHEDKDFAPFERYLDLKVWP
jgi:predicted nucleic acid-binding protein